MTKIINKKLKNSSRYWVDRQINDQFVKKAQTEGLRSRSAFKLIELNNKFKFLKNNINLVDLGSAPGGWLQIATKIVKKGKIIGIDIKPIKKIKKVEFILGDFLDELNQKKINLFFNKKVDVVMSDMASNTTGNRDTDSYRTGELCLNAITFAQKMLQKDGFFISKFFMGSVFTEIENSAKKIFKQVVKFKPQSSRKKSPELFIICKNLK